MAFPLPQRYWAILTIALGLTLAVLDGAIANVALPTIARDLHASPASSIWVVNAYQLAVTISLLPLASLGDIYGYRRVYQYGLIVFTIASLGCALSDSLMTLTVARVIQGFGAAGIMSVNGALVRFIYPRRWLGRGVGLNATIGSIASAVGPTVAAGILSVAPWPWLFAVNVPIGALAIPIAFRALPRTRRSGARFDASSAIWSALTFGILVSAISGLGHGESASLAGAELCFAMVFGFVLVTRQLSQHSPMLPVDLLRIPLFALSVATSICSFIAQSMALVVAAVPVREHPRPRPGGDRSAPDALAARRGGDRAVYRAIVRPLSGGTARRVWSCGDGDRAGAAEHAAGTSNCVRHRLAPADLRHRLRFLQHAEQPRDPHLRAAAARRRSKRHAGDVASARPEHGRGDGGADVRVVSGKRHARVADCGGLHYRGFGSDKLRQTDAAQPSRQISGVIPPPNVMADQAP